MDIAISLADLEAAQPRPWRGGVLGIRADRDNAIVWELAVRVRERAAALATYGDRLAPRLAKGHGFKSW